MNKLTKLNLKILLNSSPNPSFFKVTSIVIVLYGGSQQTDPKGSKIEQLINNQNLCLLNQKEPTHINPTNRSSSSIDLTMCDSIQLPGAPMMMCVDHYPIIIKNDIITHVDGTQIKQTG